MLSIQLGELVPHEVPLWQVWSTVGIYLAITIGFYVLRSLGLYVLAKRQGVQHKALAWIPCLWFYVACKLMGDSKFFGYPMKKLVVIFTVIFTVSEIMVFTQNFLVYFPIIGNFLMGREIVIAPTGTTVNGFNEFVSGIFVGADFVNPYGLGGTQVINTILSVFSYFAFFVDLAVLVITCTVYFGLFRRFWPQHYMLAGLLSIFLGLFAPFVFVIRKKKPINYIEYLRSRYNYNPYANPYGNPYNNPNSYNNPYNNGQSAPKSPEHPFKEFADKDEIDPGNPFKEFSNDKDTDKGN